MSRLEIDWPDEAAERVRAAQGRLRLAGPALRDRTFEDRLESVAKILGDWTAPDSPWRRELATSLAAASPFTHGTIQEGLDAALTRWSPEALIACAENEVGSQLAHRGTRLAPFDWTTVVAGGSIPMPTILSSLLPLVLGSPVLLRETRKDPVTASLLARSIQAADPELSRAFEAVSFPAVDLSAYAIALEAPCVVATGSDETLAAISSRLDSSHRFVGYGHRFSIAILGREIANSEPLLEEVAAGLALDLARWDQSGCLSPVVAYLVDVPKSVASRLAHQISERLAELSHNMPLGDLPPSQGASIASERSEAKMRAASGMGMLVETPNHTITLEADAQPRPAPLGRFLRLMPVESPDALVRALEPFSGHLSNVALAGLAVSGATNIHSEKNADAPNNTSQTSIKSLLGWLSRAGVSRFTKPGRLQTPPIDWPHDGQPVFSPLSRFTQWTQSV